VNDPLRAPSSTPLYLCLHQVWGAAGGDFLNPHYSWDHYGDQIKQNNQSKGPTKKKRESSTRRSLKEILQQGPGSSCAPFRGPVTTIEPAAEISAKGRNEPAVRNLPEVKPGTSLLGVSGTDIPVQRASISGLPAAGGEPGHLVSGVGGLRLAKKALSGYARRKLKKAKARESEAGTGGIHQPGNASAPKQGETLTETLKRARSEVSTPTEMARPPKRPRNPSGPGNYKEVLNNIKIAISKETYPEDKLTEHDQESILEELERVLLGTPIRELPHLKSYRLEGGALTYIYALTNSLVNGSSEPLTITGWDQGPD
jgi:hypothetical protein